MPTRIPKSCLKCGAAQTNGAYCEDCQPKRERPKGSDPRVHETAAWHRLRANLKAQGNTCCQWIGPDGRRCTEPTWAFHHILSAGERQDLTYNQRNVVGVCMGHHPKPNEPDQHRGGVGFVPTLWRAPMSNEPVPEAICQPGATLPMNRWSELWTVENTEAALRREQ